MSIALALLACDKPDPEFRYAGQNLAPVDGEADADTDADSDADGDVDTDTGTPTPTDTGTGGTTDPDAGAPTGYIGSPCGSDADCPYAGGVCLLDSEGFPRGTCSAACDQFCDDLDGYPTTFCTEIGALPPAVADLADGACLSRCDFGFYPFTGCRQDYGCVMAERANDAGAETYVCLPNVASSMSSCIADLAGRGVPFSPTLHADEEASGTDTICHIEEPIVLQSGYLGVDIIYSTGNTPGTVLGGCALGQAIADTIEDIAPDGVVTLRHLGTYNCRVIANTNTLSRHGYGDAIDMSQFDFANGDTYNILSDFEQDTTTSFSTDAAEWLYDTSYGWHDQQIWNIILTPNYNAAHANHFHTDLTPGSDFIGFTNGYFGPSPWENE
jgi:hypothetical protein